jgi:hypothetical protein
VAVYVTMNHVVSVLLKHNSTIVKVMLVAVQLWRYFACQDSPSLLAVELCVIFCRLDCRDHNPLFLCMIFTALHMWCPGWTVYFGQQSILYQTELNSLLFLLWCEMLWTSWRKPITEQRVEQELPTEAQQPFELLTPSCKMRQECGVWFG